MRHVQFKLTEEQFATLEGSAASGESAGQAAKRFLLEVLSGSRLVKPMQKRAQAVENRARQIEKMKQGLSPDQFYAAPQRDELDELDDVMPFGADPEVWQKKLALKAKLEELQGVPRWDEELET